MVLCLSSSTAHAFNYARSAHITTFIADESVPDGIQKKALFKFDELLELDLRYIFECSQNASEGVHTPDINFKMHDLRTKDIMVPVHTAELVHVDGRAVFHLLFSSSATRAAHISPQ